MRNIIRTALIISTLAAPAVAFADTTPAKPAPTDTTTPSTDTSKTPDKTPAKTPSKTPAKTPAKGDSTAPKSGM